MSNPSGTERSTMDEDQTPERGFVPSSLRAGDVFAGRYHVVDLLAESRGGRFWRAHDSVLGRDVAVHLIDSDDARAPELLNAARRSVGVSDRRVLRVLDADQRDGLCYVVNEWGSGATMDMLLASDGPMSPRRAAWLASEVADVVAHAHEAGVTHGQLTPEHVLIDHNGTVRIIGLAVDAALAGLPEGRVSTDIVDLVGLLYAGVTGRWAGISRSAVPEAPVEDGRVLPPRRVRAGVPRALDDLCDEVLNGRHHAPQGAEIRTARDVAASLLDHVGDPADLVARETLEAARRRTLLPLARPTSLTAAAIQGRGPSRSTAVAPRVIDIPPAAGHAQPEPHEPDQPEPDTDEPDQPEPDRADPTGERTTPTPVAEPDETQAGMPVFLDDTDDVAWIAARSVTPTPPPPLTEPEPKPLFAPPPPEGEPVRRVRPGTAAEVPPDYWPWESSAGSGSSSSIPFVPDDTGGGQQRVPGRTPLRIAAGIAAVMLLLVALVMAYNLGRGRDPLGGVLDITDRSGDASNQTDAEKPRRIDPAGVTDFDPEADPSEENSETVGNVIDRDPATTWQTETYRDQLGPALPALKSGVGVVVDLGDAFEVRDVRLDLVGSPTKFSLFLTDTAPVDVDDLDPVATQTADSERTRVRLDTGTSGRFLTVWLTELPQVPGGYRGEIAEIVVRR